MREGSRLAQAALGGIALILIAILLLGGSGCNPQLAGLEGLSGLRSFLYQLQDAEPEEIIASGFKLVVMDYSRDGSDAERYKPEEILRMRRHGITPLAYLSIQSRMGGQL